MELLVRVILLLNCAIFGTAEQELNLLVLEPIPDPPLDLPPFYQPSYAEGPALSLAAELATEMANRNSSVLPGYHLNLLYGDSGCSVPFRAIEAFAKPLSRSVAGEVSPIVGVIGPPCSLAALSVAAISGRSEVALINIPTAGTHRLQDRTRYPYSFSILDSNNLLARGLVSLAQSSNWSKVALFYDASREYFLSIAQMISGSKDVNITSDFLEPVGVSRTKLSPIRSVRNRFRVIFLLAGGQVLSRILCIAYHENYIYPSNQYVIHGVLESIVAVEFQLGSRLYSCSNKQIRETLNGSILIRQQLNRPDTKTVTSSGISLETFNKLYENRTQVHNVEPSIYGKLFYDAVWSLVLALNATATDLGSYGYGQPNITNLIAKEMTSSSFEGFSGKVKFNEITGHVDQNAQFFVITEDNGTLYRTLYSYYNEESNNITLYDPPQVNGSVFIKDTFDEVVLTAPKPLVYFILLLLLFGFLLTLALNVATCAYRKVESVKASSTKLSQVAFIGCYFQALSLLFAVLIYGFTDMINRDAVCILQQLLDITLSVGLTVLLGAICVRIWRLYRIFNRYKNPGKLLSDQYLILGTIILVVIDLALTVPAAFSPNNYQPVSEEKRHNSVIMTIVTCRRISTTKFFLWFSSSLVVSTVLLSIIFILAILTRKIPQKNFKTKSTMYLSYTLAAVVPFIIGIYLILTFLEGYVNMVLRFSTLCSLFLCLILIPCAMLFFPPLLPILRKKTEMLSFVTGISLLS